MGKTTARYLFANWKMYLNYEESAVLAKQLVKETKKMSSNVTMTVFPSALALAEVVETVKKTSIAVGAQNTYWVQQGGCTGEVSAAMYKAVGAEYALVGHSERRHLFHETNHEVREKIEAALAAGLTPVVCVGETKHERDDDKVEEVLEVQLRAAFEDIAWPADKPVIVAYEPVWAISKGTDPSAGTPCDPVDASKAHRIIEQFLRGLMPKAEIVLLYGGSVRPHNVSEYLRQPHVQGVLVGAASTKLEQWLEIVRAAEAAV